MISNEIPKNRCGGFVWFEVKLLYNDRMLKRVFRVGGK
jgi:hypothetical protein